MFRGLCLVASEAYYHLAGGESAGLTPYRTRGEAVHWWVQEGDEVIDCTKEQFPIPYDYTRGSPAAFPAAEPSARAQEVMRRVARWGGKNIMAT
jgi:hypothetical protein